MKRWLKNLDRVSPITAEAAKRRQDKACELLSLTPQNPLEKAAKDLKGLQGSFEELVAKLEADGKAPSCIFGILKASELVQIQRRNLDMERQRDMAHNHLLQRGAAFRERGAAFGARLRSGRA